jgi:hypothetical protein
MLMAHLMANAIGETRSAIIPGYKTVETSANIAPPFIPNRPPPPTNGPHKGMRVYFSNMNPDDIDDPVVKDAYLKAIAEEVHKTKQNGLQEVLPRMNRAMTRTFLDYAKKALASCPDANKQADDLAALAHLTAEERQQLKQP